MTTALADQQIRPPRNPKSTQPADVATSDPGITNTALTEYCDSRGIAMQIDRSQSLIQGVKILGIKSRNGRTYLPHALTSAVALYEGAPVNVNHPKGHPNTPRDYQDRIGRIENVRFRIGEGLFGDFRYNPKHNLVEQLLWDAEHASENVGFSHNVQARVAPKDKQLAVEAITKVNSVDLVADPATTNGLFESTDKTTVCSDKTPTAVDNENLRAASARITSTNTTTSLGECDAQAPLPATSTSIVETTLAELKTLRPDLVEALIAEQEDELAKLRDELDQFRASAAVAKKHSTIAALLEEFDLPRPQSKNPIARAITSDHFLETLMSAANESELRSLVGERAALAKHIHPDELVNHAPQPGPLSRDPADVYGPPSRLDTTSFVAAIT